MTGFGASKSPAQLMYPRAAIAEINALAAGTGDATEVNGITLSLVTAAMLNVRPLAVAWLVWCRATLAAAATLALEYTLQYSIDGGSNWVDVTGSANIANAAILTGGGGGTTEYGVFKINQDLTKLPTTANAIRIQLKPDLSAGATDTATLTAIAAFGGLQNLPVADGIIAG